MSLSIFFLQNQVFVAAWNVSLTQSPATRECQNNVFSCTKKNSETSQPPLQPPFISTHPFPIIPSNTQSPTTLPAIMLTTTSIAALVIIICLHTLNRHHRTQPISQLEAHSKYPCTYHCPPCDSKPAPIILHTAEHCRASSQSEQARTVQAIEMAVEEAKFRQRGEEQGWSGSRMRAERAEYRERMIKKTGW